MKASFLLPVALVGILATTAPAQTINWGSEVFSLLVDSKGNPLTNDFVFELGAFYDSSLEQEFTPDATNMADCYSHWRVFDRAAYNQQNGYFTSSVDMDNGGGSTSLYGLDGFGQDAFNFSVLKAYIWIRLGVVPNDPLTEWLLVRDLSWTFPTPSTGCCDPTLPLEWSISDLNQTAMPVYGYQAVGYEGQDPGDAGSFSINGAGLADVGAYTLQTASFVPEPTSAALIAMLGLLGLTRRQRQGKG